MKNMHYNSAKIAGRLVDGLSFSHASERAKYYKGTLAVECISGAVDYIPVVVHERAAEGLAELQDKLVSITGQISTVNRIVGSKPRLMVELFAYHIDILDSGEHANEVMLRGVVCKAPTFRVTPHGREISDVMLAVNRPSGRSSYIPCIVWGAEARSLQGTPVGTQIEVHGRFQSREYEKRLEDGMVELRVAHEISVSKVVTEAE